MGQNTQKNKQLSNRGEPAEHRMYPIHGQQQTGTQTAVQAKRGTN